MKKSVFGVTSKGETAYLYELTNKNNMTAKVSDFGANLVALIVPDKNGNLADVTLGYDDVKDYEENGSFFGAVIGPSANRIANASFSIDGVEYKLQVNDGKNNLHTGAAAMQRQLWETISEDDTSVKFSYKKADGELGLPGNPPVLSPIAGGSYEPPVM